MKVESLKISKVFSGGGDIHYILPRFQREYAWEKTNWQTLLDDIFSIYEIYDERNEPEHFMGALVVIGDGNRSGTISAFKLVDGQQRLTTISIALCALANLVRESQPGIYRKIRRMLENEDETGYIRYKLLPTDKYDDRETYIALISGVPIKETRSKIAEAYKYIYKQLDKRLQDGSDPSKLFLVFANCLQVVFIDLDKNERPFEIFESLNAKGKPLTQPDLVRNYIAMMLPENQQHDTFQHWEDIENRLRESRTVSRIGELTAFLRHYLAHRNGLLPNKGHVYARFRDRVQRDIPQNDESFANEIITLQRFATYYDRFLRPESEKDQDISRLLTRLKIAESATAYPFMLSLFEDYHKQHISREDLIKALELLENYLMRRFMANQPTNYLNKMFPTLARDINHSNVRKSLKKALLSRNYPSDEQIQSVFPSLPVYASSSRNRLIFILSEINYILSNGTDGHTILNDAATIEHILPQKITSAWKNTLGQRWHEIHRDLLDTIGNLTLATQKWNSSASNGTWEEKHNKLRNHGLLINSTYFANITETWTDHSIQERANWINSYAINIWSAIGEPPIVMNYRGKSPQSLVLIGEHIDVSSWRDVLWHTILFVIEHEEDFEGFADRLQSAYLTTEKRQHARQLPNEWWLYIKLSANSVVSLCSRVFEQLGLDDEDWEIQLEEK